MAKGRFPQISLRLMEYHRYQDKWANLRHKSCSKGVKIPPKHSKRRFFRQNHSILRLRISTTWLKRIDMLSFWWNTTNSAVQLGSWVKNNAKIAFSGQNWLKMAKNGLPSQLWAFSSPRPTFLVPFFVCAICCEYGRDEIISSWSKSLGRLKPLPRKYEFPSFER